jgi:hypothetical protein
MEWSPAARASARRYMEDQNGMRTISAAVIQLAENPYPPEAFHRGDYHRLRAGVETGGVLKFDRPDDRYQLAAGAGPAFGVAPVNRPDNAAVNVGHDLGWV